MTALPDPSSIECNLRFALQGLASPPDVQLRIFGPLACAGCELLEDFASARLAARGVLMASAPQDRAIHDVVTACDGLSADARKCFNAEAMADLGWIAVRKAAKAALESLNWPVTAPPFFVEVKPGHWARGDQHIVQ